MVQGADAVVRDPFEVQHLVCFELVADQQQGGEREAQSDDGNQPDGAVLGMRTGDGMVRTKPFFGSWVVVDSGGGQGCLVGLASRRSGILS